MKKSLVKQRGQAGLVLCMLLVVRGTAAQFVELTAEIHTLHWLDLGTNKPPAVRAKNWTTRCVVSTNTWLIETDFFPARHAWWFTGSNVIVHSVVTGYPSERKELFAKNHPDVVVGRGFTTVFDFADGRPVSAPAILLGELLGGTGLVTIPWLAFCSGPYLSISQTRRSPNSLAE